MPTFDGDNLIITLDAGVTEVDVINGIYEPWKDWMLASPLNRKYPQAFISDGGNPLSAIINQGSYIFLQNSSGWRIKPPEEDTTIYLTGNLAVADTTLDAFTPTIGAFTAAILGLQPVTQGVTESMAVQLEANVFNNSVCIDVINGYPGTGYINGNPIGTRSAPSNNIIDSELIAAARGFRDYQVMAPLTISGVDLSHGHKFIGDSPFMSVIVEPSANVSNCDFHNLSLFGEVDGINIVRDCSVGAITNASGIFEKCAFMSTVTLSGDAYFFECYSQVVSSGYPTVSVGSFDLVARQYGGSLGIADSAAGHLSSIGLEGGRLVVEASCLAGTIHARGMPFEIVQNQAADIVLQETFVETIWDNKKALSFAKYIGVK